MRSRRPRLLYHDRGPSLNQSNHKTYVIWKWRHDLLCYSPTVNIKTQKYFWPSLPQTNCPDSVPGSVKSAQMHSLRLADLQFPLLHAGPDKTQQIRRVNHLIPTTTKAQMFQQRSMPVSLTSESPKAASTSSKLVWYFSSKTGGLYPFLNQGSSSIWAIVIRCSPLKNTKRRKVKMMNYFLALKYGSRLCKNNISIVAFSEKKTWAF
jgi:hypothetical protein